MLHKVKFCSCCNQKKSILDFHKDNHSKDKLYAYCKKCCNKRNRICHLKRTFGLSIEEYNKKFNKQQGKCTICGRHQSELKRALDVDHNHNTRKIRDLLCYKCNLLISHCCEDIKILKNAIKYLQKYESVA